MADASGVDIWSIRQINLIQELLKASCSIVGANANSTYSSKIDTSKDIDTLGSAKDLALLKQVNSFATGIVKTVFFLNGYKNSQKFVRLLSRLADLIIHDKF
jgi:hypothetical protein